MENSFVHAADAFVTGMQTEAGNGFVVRETQLGNPKIEAASSPLDNGIQIEISRDGNTQIAARATVISAERADALRGLRLSSRVLGTSAAIVDVQIEGGDRVALLTLLYAVTRRARIFNRVSLVMLPAEARESGAAELLAMTPCSENITGLLTQRVDLAAHYLAEKLIERSAAISPTYRAREIEESVKRWLSTSLSWGFFRAVHDRSLTRQQYVYALSHIYQFVRHTTRLVARAIAYSPTTEMRSHFINHMNGEVNHELIIERDLNHMDEDVGYVRDHMAPNGPTQEFMAIQESMISYYHDPVLLMASPVAAEGVTAHLTEDFVKALQDCIASWGVSKPEKASRFFVSHMHTDGGDDGHWEMTVAFLGKVLTEESKHQFFLRSMRSAMRGTQRLYDSFVEEIPNWSEGQEQKTGGRGTSTELHA